MTNPRQVEPLPEKGWDKGTLVRTILLAAVWVNVFLQQAGLQPLPVLDEESVSLGLALAASALTWFKNQYITLKGRKQRRVLKQNNLTK